MSKVSAAEDVKPKLTAEADSKVSKLTAIADVKVSNVESSKISATGDLKVYLVKPAHESRDASAKKAANSEISRESLALLKGDTGNKDASTTSTEASITSTVTPPSSPTVPDEKGDWMVNYTSSPSICTRLVGEIKINVDYIRSNNVSLIFHLYPLDSIQFQLTYFISKSQ